MWSALPRGLSTPRSPQGKDAKTIQAVQIFACEKSYQWALAPDRPTTIAAPGLHARCTHHQSSGKCDQFQSRSTALDDDDRSSAIGAGDGAALTEAAGSHKARLGFSLMNRQCSAIVLVALAARFGMLLAAAATRTARRSALVLVALAAGALATLVAALVTAALVATLAPTLSTMALRACFAGLLGVELVGIAAGMCRAAAFAGDLALAVAVHAREAAVGLSARLLLIALSALGIVASHIFLLELIRGNRSPGKQRLRLAKARGCRNFAPPVCFRPHIAVGHQCSFPFVFLSGLHCKAQYAKALVR